MTRSGVRHCESAAAPCHGCMESRRENQKKGRQVTRIFMLRMLGPAVMAAALLAAGAARAQARVPEQVPAQALQPQARPAPGPDGAGCDDRPADLALIANLYEAGTSSSVLLALLSGHRDDAIKLLVDDLHSSIVLLGSALRGGPCGASDEQLDRIYPMLRIVAAADQHRRIPGLRDNATVDDLLRASIADNPKDYERLVKESAGWDRGIR
jgi:hypothetical protein